MLAAEADTAAAAVEVRAVAQDPVGEPGAAVARVEAADRGELDRQGAVREVERPAAAAVLLAFHLT